MRLVAVMLAASLAFASGDALAALYSLNLCGNNFSMSEPAAIGGELSIVGELSVAQEAPPFALPGIIDWSTEYTVYIHGLVLSSPPSGFQRNFTGGTIEIWAQAPPNAPWTPTTPVASIPPFERDEVPATFADGTLILRGAFSSFTILDFTMFGGDTGTITNTDIDFNGGSRLSELVARGIQNDWSWGGWFDVHAPVPGGYALLYGGRLDVQRPTPVEPATWGSIKALY